MYRALYLLRGGLPIRGQFSTEWAGSGGVGSVAFSKGLGGVGLVYGFNQNPFTFCGSISPASVSSVNVPFSATTI